MSGMSGASGDSLPRDGFVWPGAPVGPVEEYSNDAAGVLKLRSMVREKQTLFWMGRMQTVHVALPVFCFWNSRSIRVRRP